MAKNIKTYTFKINLDNPEEADLAKAIDSWKDDRHTIKSMVFTLLSKYHGLNMPRTDDALFFTQELRRIDAINMHQQKEMLALKTRVDELIEIVDSMNQDILRFTEAAAN